MRLLLIAESAPDDEGDEAHRRFFYDDVTGRDGLFRQVVRVLFDNPPLKSGPGAKVPWLGRLQNRGVYLIDLTSTPVNHYSKSERAKALKRNIEATVITTSRNDD